MKLAILWLVLFSLGIFVGHSLSLKTTKGKKQTYQLPANIRAQLETLMIQELQVRARYEHIPQIYYRVKGQI